MFEKEIVCFKCGKRYDANRIIFECENCGYSLDIKYDYSKIKKAFKEQEEFFFQAQKRHWKYWMFYPIKNLENIVSMQEGNTPLIKSSKYNYWYKYEGVNPTGVFKDRGSTVEITKAKELGIKKIVCASTGNMGASLAAYASKANIKAEIFVPGFATKAKLRQMKWYGAKIKVVRGSYEKALELTKKLHKKTGVYLTGDYPFRLEGQKSVGFEILERMPKCKNIVVPVGNGTLCYAVFKAAKEFKEIGIIRKIPKIIGIQAKGCDPIVRAFENGWKEVSPLKKTKTIASAINCGNPVDGMEALYAIRNSRGVAERVTDKEIINAKKELAKEGVYAEYSAAAALAGAKKLELDEAVLIITGHGLKDDK